MVYDRDDNNYSSSYFQLKIQDYDGNSWLSDDHNLKRLIYCFVFVDVCGVYKSSGFQHKLLDLSITDWQPMKLILHI